MKALRILIVCSVIFLSACEQDKFETTPKISIKEVSRTEISPGQNINVTLEYTDREGDVDNGLVVVRERLNKKNTAPPLEIPFTIPKFPDTNQGEINVQLDYSFALVLNLDAIRIPGSSNPVRYEIDTLRLKFALTDAQGNTSDTAILNNIYVIR